MVRFPYYFHTMKKYLLGFENGRGMGIVWKAYHKGVPLLGVPENPIDIRG